MTSHNEKDRLYQFSATCPSVTTYDSAIEHSIEHLVELRLMVQAQQNEEKAGSNAMRASA